MRGAGRERRDDRRPRPACPRAPARNGGPALDRLAEGLRPEMLDPALRSIAAGFATRALAVDLERAASRVYTLVSSVKRFTFMDRATVKEPSNIGQGVMDTVAVLASK